MISIGLCSVKYRSASWWWLRSANNNNNFNNVNSDGSNNNNNANNSGGIALGSSLARQSNLHGEISADWREGEHDPPPVTEVNIYPDRPGRTLLAWRRLMVIRRFMPSGLMRLYATIRQPYRVAFQQQTGDEMTSEERREARFQRRKAHREKRRQNRYALHDDFNWVFSYEHLYRSYQKCRRGVAWKSSTQKYITQAPLNVYNTHKRLHNGTFKSSGFYEFDILERGKQRHIRSVTISERVVQRCLCDYALVPVLCKSFIYDNGASMEHKGYSFAVRRCCQHLREHYRKHGTEGYILLFDFSKFFDRVSHRVVKGILRREFSDDRILWLTEHFIDAFGDIGMGLGSQISQVLALASASRLDHYIKEACRIRGYGRYMDDGYLIHHSKEHLQRCLKGIKAICDELEITLNTKKTQIVKLSHGFTFLKVRFFLTDTGKVIRKIYPRSVTRQRRKLKKLVPFVESGKLTLSDIYASWQSWRAYASNFNAHGTVQRMASLYDKLFIQDWLNARATL